MLFMAASMAFSAIQGARAENAADTKAAKNYVNDLESLNDKNEQIGATNLQNTIRTGYRVGILNVQRGSAKAEAVKMGYDVTAKAQQIMGANFANAAASGGVGSSIDAVSTDIQKRSDEALLDVQDQYDTSSFNFDQELNDIIQRGQDSLQTPYKIPKGPDYTNAMSGALAGAANSAIQYGAQYAAANMSLGLGGKSAAPMKTFAVSAGTAPRSNLGGSYLTTLKSS